MSHEHGLVLLAVGDIAPDREDPGSIFSKVKGILKDSDLVFGQLEAVLSERGTALPQARPVCSSKPKTAQALKAAGFILFRLPSPQGLATKFTVSGKEVLVD